jgi:hypothetical protein
MRSLCVAMLAAKRARSGSGNGCAPGGVSSSSAALRIAVSGLFSSWVNACT